MEGSGLIPIITRLTLIPGCLPPLPVGMIIIMIILLLTKYVLQSTLCQGFAGHWSQRRTLQRQASYLVELLSSFRDFSQIRSSYQVNLGSYCSIGQYSIPAFSYYQRALQDLAKYYTNLVLLPNIYFHTVSIKMVHTVATFPHPILPACEPTVLDKAPQAHPSLYKEYSAVFEKTSMEKCPLKIRGYEQVTNSCRKILKGQPQSKGSIGLKIRT